MALNFPKVSLLGLTQDSRFFGAGFHYTNTKRLSIQGTVTDLANGWGVTGMWSGVEGVLATIANNANFQPLILNGYNFGSGRIQGMSFAPGIDVKTKTYTADLIVEDAGDLFNLTGFYYSGINSNSWQYLQTFNEDYAFTRKENGGYSYNHSASIQFNSGVGQLDAITAAKTLVRTLFTGSNLGFAFYSGYTNKLGKRFYTESYDLITNACQFGETFDFDSDSGSYSVVRTNQYSLAENGIATVVEQGQIRGIVDSTYRSAQAALNAETAGAYDRCNTVFGLYANAGAYPLLSSPVISSRTIDIFQNNLGYSYTFSNDTTNSGGYTWDYTQQVTYTDQIARLTENGTVIGKAGANRQNAYAAALAGFDTVKSSVAGRSANFYSQWVGSPYAFLESQQIGYSPFKGVIQYGFNYSNEPVVAGTNGIKRIDTAIQDEEPVYRYGRFAIFNEKEIVQDEQTNTIGTTAISVNLQGEKAVPLSVYLDNAKTAINNIVNSGYTSYGTTGYFLSDATYSFSPNVNTASVNVRHEFNKPASTTVNLT